MPVRCLLALGLLLASPTATLAESVQLPSGESAPPRELVELGLRALERASDEGLVADPSRLTLIDYRLPSTEPRLWVLDLETGAVLYRERVAHGRGTGENEALHFSNVLGSKQSSLGVFLTAETYVGSNGYSLRLDGLEEGVNDRARERAIVMHGAWYVCDELARSQGRIGRSWGCPAVREEVARQLIDEIAGGSLVLAYHDDESWLSASRFVGDSEDGSRS